MMMGNSGRRRVTTPPGNQLRGDTGKERQQPGEERETNCFLSPVEGGCVAEPQRSDSGGM